MGICLGVGAVTHESGWIQNVMFWVCFFSANIYLFGMMKGRSTLIIKTNTISTKAAYVNTATAWWWMSCKWCQHLFLMMVGDTQSPVELWVLRHIGAHLTNYQGLWSSGNILTLSQSLLWLLPYLFIHS